MASAGAGAWTSFPFALSLVWTVLPCAPHSPCSLLLPQPPLHTLPGWPVFRTWAPAGHCSLGCWDAALAGPAVVPHRDVQHRGTLATQAGEARPDREAPAEASGVPLDAELSRGCQGSPLTDASRRSRVHAGVWPLGIFVSTLGDSVGPYAEPWCGRCPQRWAAGRHSSAQRWAGASCGAARVCEPSYKWSV